MTTRMNTMDKTGWQIKPIFPGRFYEAYEIINPAGRIVWYGTVEGLQIIARDLASDLNAFSRTAPEPLLISLRQLRERINDKLVQLAV